MRREKIERPQDTLPKDQLLRAWNKYLESEMGKPFYRPHQEILMPPEQVAYLLAKLPDDYMKMEPSPHMQVHLLALKRALPKLSLMQRLVVKHYYGLDTNPKTQEEVAQKVGLKSHQLVEYYLRCARKRLRALIREGKKRALREHMTQPE